MRSRVAVIAVVVVIAGALLAAWLLSRSEPTAGNDAAPPEVIATPAPGETPAAAAEPEARLPPPAPGTRFVDGLVTDATGEPVAGAEVQLTLPLTLGALPCAASDEGLEGCLCGSGADALVAAVAKPLQAPEVIARTVTSVSGRWRIDRLPPGTLRAAATHGELGAGEELEEEDDELTLRLGVSTPLELRVVKGVSARRQDDADDAAGDDADLDSELRYDPIPGATAVLLTPPFPRGTSSADGRLALSQPPGTFQVLVFAPGYLPQLVGVGEGGSEVDVLLFPPRRLSGHVRAHGRAVTGAVVSLDDESCNASTTVGSDGRFSFDRVPASRVSATARLEELRASKSLLLYAGDVNDAVLELKAGAFLVGKVTHTTTGQPIAGARVSLEDYDEDGADARTGADGRYRIGPVRSGRSFVGVDLDGEDLSDERWVADLKSGEEARLDLTVAPGAHLIGRVLDPRHQPIAGARVDLKLGGSMSMGVETNRAGAFDLGPASVGSHALRVEAAPYKVKRLDVKVPQTGFDVVLEAGPVISGVVEDERGRPLVGVGVQLTGVASQTADDDDLEPLVTTGQGGRFVFISLPPGTYEAYAVDDREPRREGAHVDVTVAAQDVHLKLVLPSSVKVEGVVTDAAGSALPEVKVHLSCPHSSGTVITRVDGRFEHAASSAGECELTASKMAWRQPKPTKVSVPQEGGPVRIVLERAALLRGRVVSEDGKPLTTFELDHHPVKHPDGRFEVNLTEWPQRLSAAGFVDTELPKGDPSGPDVDSGDWS